MTAGGVADDGVLAVRDVSKSFGPIEVLHRVSLDLVPGEVHALVGENGAGKSTLVKIVAGYHQPSSGQLLLGGRPLVHADGADGERHGIVLIHQEFNLAEDLTVEENIFLGQERRRGWFLDKRWMRERTVRLLRELNCAVAPTAAVKTLSVSQKQMVEIAKAIDRSARVLIMDEPTSVLTHKEIAILFALIRQLKSQGVAVVFVSHKLDEVEAVADRVTVLRDGHLVASRPAAGLGQDEMAELMVGRPLHDLYPEKRPVAAVEPLLEVEHVAVPRRVFDAGFTLRPGEILGFAGLVGAGRTELMEAVAGLRPRPAGVVRRNGRAVRAHEPRAAAAAGIAYLTEDRKSKGLLLDFPPRPNLTLATLRRVLRGPFIDVAAEDAALDRATRTFDLRYGGRNLPVVVLSGGNQQKLLVAKVMEMTPDIVILDEPTHGVDIGTKQQIYRFIADAAAAGKGVIVVSSEMPELIGLCHRIVVMRAGRITGVLEGDAIGEGEIVRYATGLKGAA